MSESFYDLYCQSVDQIEKMSGENKQLKGYNNSLQNEVSYLRNNMNDIIDRKVEESLSTIKNAYKEELDSLNKKFDKLQGLLNTNGSNSGIPTSKTALNKEKRIPNSRTQSSKKLGGQKGHPKNKLKGFCDTEITDSIHHVIETCSICGSPMYNVGEFSYKDELDFEIVVKKIRHYFDVTKCTNNECAHEDKVPIPTRLKEENQYGSQVQALALTMLNEGCVSISRTKGIVSVLTHQEINLSEGYISKLQKRLAKGLELFINELKMAILTLLVVHWDDTVIMISTTRACLRYYGDEQLALYTAHTKKDKIGIDNDGILLLLNKETVVVHDHNIVNYNDDYDFKNAECCVHLVRDLKKIIDNLNHEWANNLIKLLVSTNTQRNDGGYVDAKYVALQYDTCVALGDVENLPDKDMYYADTERAVLKRLKKYKDNYLMWTLNEDIPFSNNVSERGLRGSKTKMKVSGQFQNLQSAEDYATIRSYIETGKRFGLNSTELITRALEGKYVTLEEMKNHDDKKD